MTTRTRRSTQERRIPSSPRSRVRRAPGRRGGPRRGADPGQTRAAVFAAAAAAFSRSGFDGVAVDVIARSAGVNKAMIYYHFADKLALYREIVCEMLREVGTHVTAIADQSIPPTAKIARFIATFVALADRRPYFPTLMMREIAEGAPHLDAETLTLMRKVFLAFGRILEEGQQSGVFGRVHPVLAYMSVLGPLMLNAARERAAERRGRAELPMFVTVSHDDLTRHMQFVALRMLLSADYADYADCEGSNHEGSDHEGLVRKGSDGGGSDHEGSDAGVFAAVSTGRARRRTLKG